MVQKSVKGSSELASKIKLRRNELNLTIEEAASKAGVGTKTWSRYESGESIRKDKCRGICKALNWHSLPGEESDASEKLNFNAFKNNEAWSSYLMETFGVCAAASFVIGSDVLLDNLRQDMEELSSMPRGSHIGQINISWMMASSLPPQFLMRYDYDFLYILHCTITHLRRVAHTGSPIIAHSVIEELALYLIMEESRILMESIIENDDEIEDSDNWDDWVFDVFDDMDLITFLYSDWYLDNDNPYHFEHWLKRQFYCSGEEDEVNEEDNVNEDPTL